MHEQIGEALYVARSLNRRVPDSESDYIVNVYVKRRGYRKVLVPKPGGAAAAIAVAAA